MSTLKNKVALITGGNSGIGLATAIRFHKEGAKVIITGRRQEALDEIDAKGHENIFTVKADAGDTSANEVLFQKATAQYGKIDILYLNAGIATMKPFESTTVEDFDAMVTTNFKGPYFTTQAALPYLNDGSSIIFNTTVGSQIAMPGMSAYVSSKGALTSLTRALALELAGRKIRVNAVSPGPIETPIYGKLGLAQEQVQQMGEQIMQKVMLGRFGAADEVANLVTFLASQESSYITGHQFEVDGGMSEM